MMKTTRTVWILISGALVAGCTQVQPTRNSPSPPPNAASTRSESKPATSVARPASTGDDHYARGIVIQALTLPNKLGVGGREFRTKPNLKGEGVFVYDPRTRFQGVERYLIWLVLDDSAYPLNGPSKTLTPSLRWPREVDQAVWRATGLDPYVATEAIEMVFDSSASGSSFPPESSLKPPTSPVANMDALDQAALAFEGRYTREQIKARLDRTLALYGLPLTEDNYSRAGSTLVALRKENRIPEMAILDHMIRSHVPGVKIQFSEAAALSSVFLKLGDK